LISKRKKKSREGREIREEEEERIEAKRWTWGGILLFFSDQHHFHRLRAMEGEFEKKGRGDYLPVISERRIRCETNSNYR